jgi:hypothetical protein
MCATSQGRDGKAGAPHVVTNCGLFDFIVSSGPRRKGTQHRSISTQELVNLAGMGIGRTGFEIRSKT